MPRPQKKQKRLVPQITDDPVVRNNLELIQDNFDEIFRRLNKQRWAVSEESTGSYSHLGTVLVSPPTLKVKLDCTGKNPILVFMRQKSEVVAGGNVSGGGIAVSSDDLSGAEAVFSIGNATQRRTIHTQLLGGGTTVPLLVPDQHQSWIVTYPANALMAFDESPDVGLNSWEVFINGVEPTTTVVLQDCDLVAVELF